jgi:Hemerythrin HHE cation binding domain
VDITQLILDDHHEQRRRFAMLEQVAPSDTSVLANLWTRLAVFLEVHAAAEEEIFYPELLRLAIGSAPVATAEPETLDAIGDHNEIRDAIADVANHPVGTVGWHQAVADVNMANGDHMAEEEREGLTDFRLRVSLQKRHELAVAFVDFEARNFAGITPVDRDPQTYVRETEAAERGLHSSGSLEIGGLRNLS